MGKITNLARTIAVVVFCSLPFFDFNDDVNAQARDRFMKEAPVAWAEYRQKLSTNIRIEGRKLTAGHFEFLITDQSHIMHKFGERQKQMDFVLLLDGHFYYEFDWDQSKWTAGLKDREASGKELVNTLKKNVESEVFRLLLVDYDRPPYLYTGGMHHRYLDELMKENPNIFESVKAIALDGKEFIEIVFNDSDSPNSNPRICTVILDPQNHWTITKIAFLTKNNEYTSRKTVSFETTEFLGSVVPTIENIDDTTTSVDDIMRGILVVKRKFTEIDQEYFDRACAGIRELAPSNNGIRVEMDTDSEEKPTATVVGPVLIAAVGVTVAAIVVFFVLFRKKTRTERFGKG